tara:strand:- start:200 stop:427 length:228 start_codon:yes stop_codon:yes gene_type:complete
MEGYIYNDENVAIEARQLAANYKGLPIHPNDTTIYWVNYDYSELDLFYYIQYVEGLEVVLGVPVKIVLTLPDILI